MSLSDAFEDPRWLPRRLLVVRRWYLMAVARDPRLERLAASKVVFELCRLHRDLLDDGEIESLPSIGTVAAYLKDVRRELDLPRPTRGRTTNRCGKLQSGAL